MNFHNERLTERERTNHHLEGFLHIKATETVLRKYERENVLLDFNNLDLSQISRV